MLKNRRAKLERFFNTYTVDAILLTNLLNIRYLCGFSGSEGALLLTRESGWFLCDSRYTTQAAAEVKDLEVVQFTVKQDSIHELIKKHGYARVGFEAGSVTVAEFKALTEKADGVELVAINKDLDEIRSCKDIQEVELLKHVAGIASASLLSVLSLVKPGVTESEVARELEFEMRRRGAEGRAFDFIVASGERGAMPHGRASDKFIETGELVTIDFGAALSGVYSDETVTVYVGEKPSQRQHEVYNIVNDAHDLAVAAVKPGMACREIDAIARNHITAKGYGEYFGHGLGHGVGLEIHEKPVISPRSEAVAEEGMVFTIEPGIYIPGFGGVRIEDTVVVTPEGCELLTQVPKGLICL